MNKLKKIQMKETDYYFGNDIAQLNLPGLKKYTNGRRLVEDQGISNKHYMFVRHDGDSWIKSSDKSCKFDKIIIKADYVEKHIFPKKMKPNKDDDEEEDEDDEDDEDDEEEDNEEEDNEEENEITIAPGIIKLSKKEKMKDNSGNIIEIEVRGTRDHDNCYFRVSDVSVGFGMKKLHDTITKKGGYEENNHYRYFYIDKNPTNSGKSKKVKSKKPLPKKLFLTYLGLLKVLFVSRNKTVGNFLNWATETLFTAHLGTQDQKNELSSKLMGISANIVKEVFSTTSSTLPTIYLFSIGKVKDLRATLKIDKEYNDNDIVCKVGETIDLTRRINEHNATYGKLPGANLCLKWYNYIDPQHTSKAETELLMLLDKLGHKLDHPKYDELIIFPKDKKAGKFIIDQFKNVSNKYIGHVKVLVDKIKELENEIKELKYQNEINELKYKNIILEKDLEISNLNKKLKKKK
ncbi:hypothetical protein [Acanthamoeba polyphaga mimivirus]|uniref:Uncharacterized protein L5 n=7 Tax=Megamimivirinae TaxID=3044648 RepID=YL005_MIMIV|nr:hypothetical protein MIMI_gp0005 [Acanthamoeba polyphaga mimivirus]Q5UP82.1 RecName: Full=Uncharacterized protein L5 [Acanthamoeba polyphaga mimivirus]AHA45885.1 hypothetical protein HIRU_S979 [Hirudovirus strain Sangsue]AHJ39842.2 hypothetical protein [Samba virus]AMZ02458.1 hypothetical protein [Mimivirus Bombay]AUV57998.1 hypothetical protein [Bandra megavirus]AAV50280.1 unknown [Acanthamoeba polyphaga mimivirus]